MSLHLIDGVYWALIGEPREFQLYELKEGVFIMTTKCGIYSHQLMQNEEKSS